MPAKPELHLQLELSNVEPALQKDSWTALGSQVLQGVQEEKPAEEV